MIISSAFVSESNLFACACLEEELSRITWDCVDRNEEDKRSEISFATWLFSFSYISSEEIVDDEELLKEKKDAMSSHQLGLSRVSAIIFVLFLSVNIYWCRTLWAYRVGISHNVTQYFSDKYQDVRDMSKRFLMFFFILWEEVRGRET